MNEMESDKRIYMSTHIVAMRSYDVDGGEPEVEANAAAAAAMQSVRHLLCQRE